MAIKEKKICVVTGTRAEYGLLYWLLKGLQEDADFHLQLIATGTHLSPEYGLTYQEIEKDGFVIDRKIEIILSSDTPAGIVKSLGLAHIGFAEAFAVLQPDMVIVLGDRYEVFAAAATALIFRIPIGHISGGETTLGAMDEAFRHSITKMAQLHFVSTEIYKKRVIQLGEDPQTVFNVGATGLDNIKKLKLLDKKQLGDSLGFQLGEVNFLVTFHPVTLEKDSAGHQFLVLLEALDQFPQARIIFTMPNADTDSRIIIEMIKHYVAKNTGRAAAFVSLGPLRYLSAIKNGDVVIGNSSSGITEVPLLHKPTVNIGDRQKGRIMSDSIISCEPEKAAIAGAIQQALSADFQASLSHMENIYGNGTASEQIMEILRNYPIENLTKKRFYDIQ